MCNHAVRAAVKAAAAPEVVEEAAAVGLAAGPVEAVAPARRRATARHRCLAIAPRSDPPRAVTVAAHDPASRRKAVETVAARAPDPAVATVPAAILHHAPAVAAIESAAAIARGSGIALAPVIDPARALVPELAIDPAPAVGRGLVIDPAAAIALELATDREAVIVLEAVTDPESVTDREAEIDQVFPTDRAVVIGRGLVTDLAVAIVPGAVIDREAAIVLASVIVPALAIVQALAIAPESATDRAAAIVPAAVTDRGAVIVLALVIAPESATGRAVETDRALATGLALAIVRIDRGRRETGSAIDPTDHQVAHHMVAGTMITGAAGMIPGTAAGTAAGGRSTSGRHYG